MVLRIVQVAGKVDVPIIAVGASAASTTMSFGGGVRRSNRDRNFYNPGWPESWSMSWMYAGRGRLPSVQEIGARSSRKMTNVE